jgi:hypothetical protein
LESESEESKCGVVLEEISEEVCLIEELLEEEEEIIELIEEEEDCRNDKEEVIQEFIAPAGYN